MKIVLRWCAKRSVLALVVVCVLSAVSSAAPIAHQSPPPMQVDGDTAALYRFDNVNDSTVPDLTDGGRDATLNKDVALRPTDRLPGFSQVAHFDGKGVMTLPGGADLLAKGAWTIDIRLRVESVIGIIATAGHQATFRWGVLYRGAGHLWVMVPDEKGERGRTDFNTLQFLKDIGPPSSKRYYIYSLTYDGKDTFAAYIDGELAWTGKAEHEIGPLKLNGDLQLGVPANWKSNLRGMFAEVRISSVARKMSPRERNLPSSLSQMSPNYRFDFGGMDTPVSEGFLPVTPDDVYSKQKGFGFDRKAIESHDAWFTAGRYQSILRRVLDRHEEQLRNDHERDGITVKSGSTFRADIKPGTYAVSVTLGHMRKNQRYNKVLLNGQPIGEELRMANGSKQNGPILTTAEGRSNAHLPEDRTIRQIVTIKDDGLALQMFGVDDQPCSILDIEIEPWAEPVVQRNEQGELTWHGQGSAPAQLQPISDALQNANLAKARELAAQVNDPLARCTLQAWILGYPAGTSEVDVKLAEQIRGDLVDYLKSHPTSQQAKSLLEATDIMYPILRCQIDDGNGVDELVGGTWWRWLYYGADYGLRVAKSEPYYGRARLLAGTLLHQKVEQSGGMIDKYTYRKPERHSGFPPPVFYLELASKAYPNARLARIYMGEQLPDPKTITIPKDTPEWARWQHHTLVRVMDIIHYWTDNRQDANGMMGGGLGDDVETMRWWSVGHLVADDEKTRVGWRNLALSAWRNTRGEGYQTRQADVEHGAEPVGDTLTFLGFIDFGTDRFEDTLKKQAVLYDRMKNLWMSENPAGYMMFRSYMYSSRDVSERDMDHYYNVRAANPMIMRTWFKREPEMVKLLVDWAKSWRDATMASGDGKPAGIIPIALSFKERNFIHTSKAPWYDPGYYNYPGGIDRLYNLMLAGYEMSGDDSLLDPIRTALEGLRGVTPPDEETAKMHDSYYRVGDIAHRDPAFEKGTLEWALWYGRKAIGQAGGQYRIITGDTQFDDVLLQYAPPVVQSRIKLQKATTAEQRRQAMAVVNDQMQNEANKLDYNNELRTSEPKSTDRVWVGGTEPIIAAACGSSLSNGIRGSERHWPIFGVSYRKTGTDVAAFIEEHRPDHVSGYFYNFADAEKQIGIHFWRLKPGEYVITLRDATDFEHGKEITTQSITITNPGDLADITLPAGKQVYMTVVRK